MKRIGIAASKMARGDLWAYNLLVVLLAFLFSLLIFLVSGASIVFALVIIGYVLEGIFPTEFDKDWGEVIRVCMMVLTGVISLLTLAAISVNLKFRLPTFGGRGRLKSGRTGRE